jgi:hypothetical protein
MPSVMLLRIMIEEPSTHNRAYQAALVIGGVGAFGQAALLWHELVNCLPYREMSDLSAGIGYTGLLAAPILAIVALNLLKPMRLWLVPMLPVVFCPVFFWGMYKAAFLLRGRGGNVAAVGGDFYEATAALAERQFAHYAMSLGLTGMCAGIVCGLVLWLLFKSKRHA